MSPLALPVRQILERGDFCHVAALTPMGPHVTPMVFALAGGRLWVTTSRGSVKARAWRADPSVAGLVRAGDDAVVFTGTAVAHDALEPSTWVRSLVEAPLLSLAAARFTRRNARFFAGYAVDARRVPLAWTPPGRVFVEISVERAAVLRDRRPPRRWGAWGRTAGSAPSAGRFRAARAGEPPLAPIPLAIRSALGTRGTGALALQGVDGPVVLPVAWAVVGAGLYAVLDEGGLALASLDSAVASAALGMDHPSSWRARDMVGAMARGTATVHVGSRLGSGARSAADVAAAAGGSPEDAVVAVRPDRFVWWRGWESGTVAA